MSLPGAAVWHVPWHAKDDTLDWQAYFHARNRIVTALLHSPYDRGGNMVKESLFITAKHALAMQYSTAELMLPGAGGRPARARTHLHASIDTKMAEIRALRAGFADARAGDDLDDFPTVQAPQAAAAGPRAAAPEGPRRWSRRR